MPWSDALSATVRGWPKARRCRVTVPCGDGPRGGPRGSTGSTSGEPVSGPRTRGPCRCRPASDQPTSLAGRRHPQIRTTPATRRSSRVPRPRPTTMGRQAQRPMVAARGSLLGDAPRPGAAGLPLGPVRGAWSVPGPRHSPCCGRGAGRRPICGATVPSLDGGGPRSGRVRARHGRPWASCSRQLRLFTAPLDRADGRRGRAPGMFHVERPWRRAPEGCSTWNVVGPRRSGMFHVERTGRTRDVPRSRVLASGGCDREDGPVPPTSQQPPVDERSKAIFEALRRRRTSRPAEPDAGGPRETPDDGLAPRGPAPGDGRRQPEGRRGQDHDGGEPGRRPGRPGLPGPGGRPGSAGQRQHRPRASTSVSWRRRCTT